MKDYVKDAANSIKYIAENVITKQRIERAARAKGLPVDDFDWDACWYNGLHVTLEGVDREGFRAAVAKVVAVLGPPELNAGKANYADLFEVTATWKEAFMVGGTLDGECGLKLPVKITARPSDCKLAEVEETLPALPERTVKVKKPHPECVEAIRQLEEAL